MQPHSARSAPLNMTVSLGAMRPEMLNFEGLSLVLDFIVQCSTTALSSEFFTL